MVHDAMKCKYGTKIKDKKSKEQGKNKTMIQRTKTPPTKKGSTRQVPLVTRQIGLGQEAL